MGTELEIRENISLAPLTTFGIGGEARFFVEVETEEELTGALLHAKAEKLPVFILGGGSNVLISDRGYEGLVVKIDLKGISIMEVPGDNPEGTVLVTARAGEDWDEFVGWCVNNDLAGLECLSGIPGSVGGTPIQNVGAYGQEVSESIVSVRVLRRHDLEIVDIPGSECGFAYRSSIFNTTENNRFAVLSVTYELRREGAPKIEYYDLKKALGVDTASLSEVRTAVRSIRASKGMLVRQGGADSRSAGSFFKNPVVDREVFERVVSTALELGITRVDEGVPNYPGSEGKVKIPAAWLIEQSGFPKGYRKGNAGLSTVHTLALTNRGGASADEMIALKNDIQARVLEVFGITLVPEPTFIGFESGADSSSSSYPV